MKKIFVIAIMLCVSITFAQEEKNIKIVDKGDLTEVAYYYDNGILQQEGTFNKDGELHGVWTSYNVKGEKVAVGTYFNGEKVGKWFFWANNEVIREVDYDQSRIVMVNEMDSPRKGSAF